MNSLQSGQRLLHYRILHQVGQGGMGEVYKAEDLKLGRYVAIKVLRPESTKNESTKQRFFREARSASVLNHPNIVTIHSIDRIDSLDFIVMEYVEGTSLREKIISGPLELSQLLEIGYQLAHALSAAHRLGLIHRDIKPENILLTPEGVVKILDFGLAKTIESLPDQITTGAKTVSQLTKAGTLVGTVAYMSPEQTRGETLDGRSDIFSLGIVLYEAATARLPFTGSTAFSTMYEIVTTNPPSPSSIKPDLPLELDLIVERAMAKDKKQRLTALELAEALKRMKGSGSQYAFRTDVADESSRPESESHSFVGREKEVKHLQELLQAAIDGAGKIVFISGEPGIGKTALADYFLTRVRQNYSSLLIARGHCVEQYGTGVAYRPFLDALSSLLVTPARERIVTLLRDHAPTLCMQLPAAVAMPSNEALERMQRSTIAASKDRMLREVGDVFGAMTLSGPLVLLIEDLHWADPSSIDLLRHLGIHVRNRRLLVLATLRPEDVERSNHPLKICTLELQTHKLCDEILLQLFDQENIQSYLNTRFDPNEFPQELAGLIHTKTDGQPLFAVSLIQFLKDRGDIVQIGNTWTLSGPVLNIDWEVPQNVRSMIRKKVTVLQEEDQRVLQYASVQGDSFLSNILAKALGADNAGIEERLDRIERVHRLIHATGEEELPDGSLAMRYRFVHTLYQNILYQDLVTTRRIQLHLQTAELLAQHYGNHAAGIAAQLAMHFELGRNFQRAVRYLIQAGENAGMLYAYAEAENHYTKALALVEKLSGEEQSAILFQVQKQLAKSYLQSGSYDKAIEIFQQCLSSQSENSKRAEIYLGVGQVYQEKGESEKAIQQLETTLKMLGKSPPGNKVSWVFQILFQAFIQIVHSIFPSSIRQVSEKKRSIYERQLFILFVLIRIYYFANMKKLAWAGLVAINLAERLRSKLDLSIACGYYGAILMGIGFLKWSAGYHEKSLALARQSKDATAEALALSRSGGYALFANDLEKAKTYENQSVNIFKQVGEMWELQTSLMLEATGHFLASEFEIAEQLYQEMGKVGLNLKATMHQAWAYSWAPFCRYLLGKDTVDNVRAQLMKGLQLSLEVDDHANQCVAHMHLAGVAVREEEPEKAAELAVTTFQRIIQYRVFVPFVQVALIHAGEAALYALEQKATSVSKNELLRIVKRSYSKAHRMGKRYPYLLGPSLRIKARFVRFTEGADAAEKIFSNAIETLKKTPNRWETGLAFLDAALALPSKQKDYLAHAKNIFEEIGALAELRRLERVSCFIEPVKQFS